MSVYDASFVIVGNVWRYSQIAEQGHLTDASMTCDARSAQMAALNTTHACMLTSVCASPGHQARSLPWQPYLQQ